MRLKRLELSGFKSFAKTAVLEFPSAVTGIVGPNGSGKSNIKEAIQWVLGEQSMKSLRGKRGEDLIWNGSPELARMGKASVTLVFDNADGKAGLDFDEVAIQRRIFRDGVNEYSVNDSPVRLKDVTELTARMGLGEYRHNIIGQGEVDRVLLASRADRYRLLEEALGLRVYQLKKAETERKLLASAQNISQAEGLIRELAPHLKFLKSQAHKASTRAALGQELKELEMAYLIREEDEIRRLNSEICERLAPLADQEEKLREEIAAIEATAREAEQALAGEDEASGMERAIASLEEKRREIERELGRLEGRLEVHKSAATGPRVATRDAGRLEKKIAEFLASARLVLRDKGDSDHVGARMAELLDDLEEVLRGGTEEEASGFERDTSLSVVTDEMRRAIGLGQEELSKISEQSSEYVRRRAQWYRATRAREQRIRQIDEVARAKKDQARDLALARQRIQFDAERIHIRDEEFMRELASTGIERASLDSGAAGRAANISQGELLKKIQHKRIRLEEIGGIDPALLKECDQTEARHAFLVQELEDLKNASVSLKDLMKELDAHIKKDFREGFVHIRDAFGEYFRLIFGGGRATLEIVRANAADAPDEMSENESPQESEPGVELSVDLPRKRIRGLAMLSGGERALASIALLFAISAVNPPPFLILDETDAALDEANSERFAALLKELSKKTQLLVITHNRETMKSAGILYGVTMGHDSVSKLVSLKLEDAEAYTNRGLLPNTL